MELGNYQEAEKYFLKDIAQQKRGEGGNDIYFNSLLFPRQIKIEDVEKH